MCVVICTGVGVSCVRICVCGVQKAASNIIPQELSTLVLEQSLSHGPGVCLLI